MGMAWIRWCLHDIHSSTTFMLITLSPANVPALSWTFAGSTGASCQARSLRQQQAPLPEELTVQSFSDFSATQLRNVTAAQAAAASATAAASAAVAAVYHISECRVWDSAGA